jgi:phosphatidylserine/phosphatidylglycerophosphate/cardiolipin synthase-like enzyme
MPLREDLSAGRARWRRLTVYLKFEHAVVLVLTALISVIIVSAICSSYQKPADIEKLMDAGIPSSALRIQPHVHNKGMIVDHKTVVVSSQNWSADGTLRNRDAGLIIYDCPQAAQYFAKIFLHDWAYLAAQHAT